MQSNATHCNAMQCNAMQCKCSAVQCSAMQCNGVQYNAIPLPMECANGSWIIENNGGARRLALPSASSVSRLAAGGRAARHSGVTAACAGRMLVCVVICYAGRRPVELLRRGKRAQLWQLLLRPRGGTRLRQLLFLVVKRPDPYVPHQHCPLPDEVAPDSIPRPVAECAISQMP